MAFIRYAHGFFNTGQVVKVEHETETSPKYTVFLSDGEKIRLDGEEGNAFGEFLAQEAFSPKKG